MNPLSQKGDEHRTRLAGLLRDLADELETFRGPADAAERNPQPAVGSIVHVLRRYIAARHARKPILASRLLADPGWDILLDLFLSELEERNVTVTDACLASGSPQTTGLRWIGMLEREGAVVRRQDPRDRRRFYIELSERTRASLAAWVVRDLAPAMTLTLIGPIGPVPSANR